MVWARWATTAAEGSTTIAPWTPSTSRRLWRIGSSMGRLLWLAPQRRVELLLEHSDGFGGIDVDPEDFLVVERDQARAPRAGDRDPVERSEAERVAAPGQCLGRHDVH